MEHEPLAEPVAGIPRTTLGGGLVVLLLLALSLTGGA